MLAALTAQTDWNEKFMKLKILAFAVALTLATNLSAQPSGMVLIPAGSFVMGNCIENEGWGDELPLHTVFVSAFYMDKFDITYGLWQQVFNWATNHGYEFDNSGYGKAANHPVVEVNWYDSVKWCNARSEMEGQTPAYYTDASQTIVYRTGDSDISNACVNWNAGYCLPSEAEWEKAARGGLSGQRFPWGNTINETQANYHSYDDYWNGSTPYYSVDVNSYSGFNTNFATGSMPYTSPVNYFTPNGYGLYDMAGNVCQWCWDWVGNYSSDFQSDPHGPAAGSNRVYRGGCWQLNIFYCRTAYRYSGWAVNVSDNTSLGFRSVLPASGLPAIAAQPLSQTAQAGTNVSFSVLAAGTLPLNYQWQFNSQNIAGQTASSLSLTNVQFANAGGYSVSVTNAYGSVTSAVAQLTVFTNLFVTQTNRTPTTNEIGRPTIPTDTNHFKVYTNGMFKSGIALNPNKMTVVLTHGWRGNPNDWAAYTAQIIQQRIGVNTVNIVAWDWSRSNEAGTVFSIPGLQLAAMRTQGQGVFLGKNLITALGSNYSQRIHFIGHSLGTLVNAAAANYVHTNGFSWSNTQMTLCDEAEVAWVLESSGWQMATTLPEITQQGVSTLQTFDGNFSTPQPGWAHPLPNQYAWADNYISLVGLLHSNAANVILTFTYPSSLPDVSTVIQEFLNFHDYSHYFYEDTIETGILNTGGQNNATYAGFLCSFEGGGYAGRPAANTYFYQDPSGLELNLVPKDLAFATNFLNARFKIYKSIGISTLASQGENGVFGAVAQAVGQVTGQIQSTGQNFANMVLNFFTSLSGGPVPKGGGTGNTPAYAWVPLNVPSNALSMSFDFMLQGNGNNDSFQVALNGTNVLSLETSLIQTNVLLNSGLIDVSQYAGRQVTLFMGILGGTSTNASLTASDFQFYAALPPSLQIQLAGTNVVVSWPLWAAGYVLQTTDKLRTTNSWAAVTNVPVIVNFQYTVTNQISGSSRFYRLAIIPAPALQARVSGKSFILSWPTNATGYVLQTTTNLAAANSWAAVTNTPATVNQQSVVTNPISGAARFYRLRQ